MPRKCLVFVEEAVAVIKQFIDHFPNGTFPAWSDEVWKRMSAALNNRWNFQCTYTNVTNNRRNIFTLALQETGIAACASKDQNNNQSEQEDSASEVTDASDNETDFQSLVHKKQAADCKTHSYVDTFDVHLTEAQWETIEPKITSGKMRKTLQPGAWTNLIAIEIWKQYRLPCAFVFKDSSVGFTEDKLSCIIKITGKCRSETCGNILRGTGEKNLKEAGLVLEIEARDTRIQEHEFLKRPFNGELRKEARKDLRVEGSAGYRKRLARENMRPGDTEPPFMPSATVARQAKKESIDAELGIKKTDGRDVIRTIEKMKTDTKLCGVIDEIGALPFHVIYSTQSQLGAYKEYCRLIVRALNREDGSKSGHIFLYTIVVNFDCTTVSVGQMLCEKHDKEFITYWLKRWLRKGAPLPKEAVCDYSRGLLSALSLALNNLTIKAYISSCFNAILQGEETSKTLPTRVCVDVAHLVHLVCRWKCFTTANQACFKDFYIRCIALMVECRTLQDFKHLFSLTCAVALHTHEDAEIDRSLATTPKNARLELENCIAVRGVNTTFIESRNKIIEKDGEETVVDPFDVKLGPDECDINVSINAWIDRQIELAKKVLRPGKNLNAFYLPAYVKPLSKLSKEFPLWSSVGMSHRSLHATSAYVEGYFNDLKIRVLKTTPLRVDVFMKTHANDITGANFVFASQMIKHNANRLNGNTKPIEEPPKIIDNVSSFIDVQTNGNDIVHDDSDLKSIENWKGKGAVPVADNTYQFEGNDHNILSNDSIFEDLPSSTLVPTKQIEDIILHDAYLGDHSYSKINEGDIDLDSWSHEPIHTDDIEIFPLVPEVEKLNSASTFDVVADVHYDAASMTDVSFVPKNEITSTFNKENVISSKDTTAKHLCESASAATAIRSASHEDFQLKDLTNEKTNANAITAKFSELQSQKPSKYFRSFPEIRHRNTLVAKTKKPWLLPNGSKCRLVKINGLHYCVQNTCPFDSIVQSIVHYFDFVKQSTNRTLQFVYNLIESGVTPKLLCDRALILKSFIEITDQAQTDKRVLSVVIDAFNNIQRMAENIPSSEPSVKNIEECSHSGRTTYSQATVDANYKVICQHGFNALEKALNLRSPIFNVSCRHPCKGSFTWFKELNIHRLVMMDIRRNVTCTTGITCLLKQLPVSLRIPANNETPVEYRLAGVVDHKPAHYVAYCRRATGCWEKHDDMQDKIVPCSDRTEIEPHLALYIRVENNMRS